MTKSFDGANTIPFRIVKRSLYIYNAARRHVGMLRLLPPGNGLLGRPKALREFFDLTGVRGLIIDIELVKDGKTKG
jgi:hypothetical protein